jgi:hypothetical protein
MFQTLYLSVPCSTYVEIKQLRTKKYVLLGTRNEHIIRLDVHVLGYR